MQRAWSSYFENDESVTALNSRLGLDLPSGESSTSHINSMYSSGSTRHMLSPTAGSPSTLAPPSSSLSFNSHRLSANDPRLPSPSPPFVSSPSPRNSSTIMPSRAPSRAPSPAIRSSPNDASGVSLSVNYLPNKFSSTMLSPTANPRKRRTGGTGSAVAIPKFGGGVDAFRAGEDRMGRQGTDDDDDDGRKGTAAGKPRWNKFKWALFVANTVLTIYSIAGLIGCLLTWFNIWDLADVVRVGNRTELIISTLAASLGIFTALVGWAGILLNNRTFLASYTALLWLVFIFLVIPGYMTYKRRTFNLEGKVNAQWSRDLGALGRLRIQNQLRCCGYFSPFIEATVSQTCYSRSILPGCKLRYIEFQEDALLRWFRIVFCLVPVHLAIMITGLLCSNHVTYRFGKGMMPKRYRLSLNSMAIIIDNYANQLAERYGSEVASEVLTHSRSQLGFEIPKHQSSSGNSSGTYTNPNNTTDRLAPPPVYHTNTNASSNTNIGSNERVDRSGYTRNNDGAYYINDRERERERDREKERMMASSTSHTSHTYYQSTSHATSHTYHAPQSNYHYRKSQR